jgi:hypothetical protein
MTSEARDRILSPLRQARDMAARLIADVERDDITPDRLRDWAIYLLDRAGVVDAMAEAIERGARPVPVVERRGWNDATRAAWPRSADSR